MMIMNRLFLIYIDAIPQKMPPFIMKTSSRNRLRRVPTALPCEIFYYFQLFNQVKLFIISFYIFRIKATLENYRVVF